MKSGIRILTSCLLIAVLCILALSSMAYVLYGDYSRHQTEERYLSDFTYSVTLADAFPESIASSARQLAELSVFTDAAQQGTLRMTGVMEQLAEFTDTGYQPALMLQGQPQYVYTPDGKIAYTQYEEQLYEYGINGDMSQIFTTMLKSDKIKLRRVNESGVLCYTMAVGNRWDSGRGTLLVLMDETLLTSCFYGDAEDRRCDVYLLSENGTFLCRDCCREGGALTAQEVNGGSVNGINYKTIGGKRLVIAKAASSTGLFSFCTLLLWCCCSR